MIPLGQDPRRPGRFDPDQPLWWVPTAVCVAVEVSTLAGAILAGGWLALLLATAGVLAAFTGLHMVRARRRVLSREEP